MGTKFTPEDLLKRLEDLALDCQKLTIKLPKVTHSNRIYGAQLIRSSSSPGSNYIEAIEATSRKDFIYRLRVCRKETKESRYWLRLIKRTNNQSIQITCNKLIKETEELIRIFSSSIITVEKGNKS